MSDAYDTLVNLMADVKAATPFLALPEEAPRQARTMMLGLDAALRRAGVTYVCPVCNFNFHSGTEPAEHEALIVRERDAAYRKLADVTTENERLREQIRRG